jgi:undecaprenyl-diphosphatase
VNLGWLILSAVGLAIVVAAGVAARHDHLPRWEIRVFQAVNGLPAWLYWILWVPMQLGNLVVGTVVGLICALVAGRVSIAIGVVVAMVLKLVSERIVRREVKNFLEARQRPGACQPVATLRGGDVPRSGPSFPSGHVILVTAIGCVVAPALPAWWVWPPLVLALTVMVGRVYVGAHNPLDVIAGFGTGLLVGGALAALIA